jgi:hypothetical protein
LLRTRLVALASLTRVGLIRVSRVRVGWAPVSWAPVRGAVCLAGVAVRVDGGAVRASRDVIRAGGAVVFWHEVACLLWHRITSLVRWLACCPWLPVSWSLPIHLR